MKLTLKRDLPLLLAALLGALVRQTGGGGDPVSGAGAGHH